MMARKIFSSHHSRSDVLMNDVPMHTPFKASRRFDRSFHAAALLLFIGLICMALVGCGGDDEDASSTDASTTDTSTVADADDATTTSAESDAAGASADATTTVETGDAAANDGSTTTQSKLDQGSSTTAASTASTAADGADGSGCTPGEGPLGDGRWFGFVEGADDEEIQFDVACWFSGTAAAQAAAEDGEESPPPNDYYVRNDTTLTRPVPVAAGATVTWLPQPGNPTAETIAYADWDADRDDREFNPGAWVTVEDGAVTYIEEQYTP